MTRRAGRELCAVAEVMLNQQDLCRRGGTKAVHAYCASFAFAATVHQAAICPSQGARSLQ
jgi:hypothetical protein